MTSKFRGRSALGALTVGAVAVGALGYAPAATAATPTQVRSDAVVTWNGTGTLPAGWSRQHTSNGEASVGWDDRSSGNGLVHLYAPANEAESVRHPIAIALSAFTSGGYDAEVIDGAAAAPYQLAIDCNGPTAGGTAVLSFNAPAQTAGWKHHDVVQGGAATWVSDSTIMADGTTQPATTAPDTGGIAANTPTPLSSFKSACANGQVVAYGVQARGGASGAESVVDGIELNGATADFVYTSVDRISGTDRVTTAIAGSKALWDDGQAGGVVLANSMGYADGLSGGPLASAFGGPLLLNPQGSVDSRVKAEISRILPVKDSNGDANPVFLIGSTASLSSTVESTISAMGYDVVRLGGSDRFGTAVAVANFLANASYPVSTILLTSGMNFPDALSAGPAAYHTSGVVLLTNSTRMPSSTQQFINAHSSAVRWAVGRDAATAAGSSVTAAHQVYGADRYETATKVARAFFSGPQSVELASGEAFPDALGAGAFSGSVDAPLVLVRQSALPSVVGTYLSDVHGTTDNADGFGGTTSIGDGTLNAVEGKLNPMK